MKPNTATTTYYYPNKMGRITLLALEEILGRTGYNAVLNLSNLQHYISSYPPNNMDLNFPFEHLSKIQSALENLYGVRGGLGLSLRTGRVCLKYGLQEFGALMGINDLAFRLLPLHMKLEVGARAFAKTFNDHTDQVVRIEEDESQYFWIIERCPICWKRKADHRVCHLAVGILQEALHWVSGGRYFQVEETACIALGDDTCTICIDKEPII